MKYYIRKNVYSKFYCNYVLYYYITLRGVPIGYTTYTPYTLKIWPTLWTKEQVIEFHGKNPW